MILMGGYNLPSATIREMITSSVDIIIQAARMRDGSRKITHIAEVIGLEGNVITLQDLFVYDLQGEDANGRLVGRHRATGIARPHFYEKARYFGEEKRLTEILSSAEVHDEFGRPLGERFAQS
jgi:pilus assembly protein CpaF